MFVSFVALAWTTAFLVTTRLVSNWLKLRSVPGPLLAATSDLWRAFHQYRGTLRATLEKLHEKYGTVVRYGVASVSISDPKAVTSIYESRSGFVTADSYRVIVGIHNGKEVPSLVSIADEAKHIALRKSISPAFTPAGVLDYEVFIDQGIDELLKVLEKEPTVDFARWMLLYSMDVSSRMLFSESLGFLESGSDVGGTIQVIHDRFVHWGNWSSFPTLERLIFRNPLSLNMKRTPSSMAAFAFSKLRARMAASTPPPQRDILQKFIEASQTHPKTLDTAGITGLLMSTISGAGDTTAATVAATIYFLLKTPAALDKLLSELHGSGVSNRPQYSETSKLPYLNAVIRESMRCFPSATWPIERKVPAGGITLDEIFLPEGTSVGCQPSVVHRDQTVFGEHTERFHPDRWLHKSDEQLRLMDRAHLGFGKGKRLCLGQHIAIMQLKKLIPMLIMKFKMNLMHPDSDLSADMSAAVACLNPLYIKFEIHQTQSGAKAALN